MSSSDITAVGFLPQIASFLGWIYTLSWSLSFYPQPLLNFSRHSTSGTTIDFPTLNILGFIALSVSNAAFLYSSTVKEQYKERNGGLESSVRVNDLVFAVHGLVLSVLCWSMFWPRIWGWEEGSDKRGRARERRISGWIAGVGFGCVGAVVVVMGIVAVGSGEDVRVGWAWIDAIYTISYVKVIVTLVKYTPQILTNYRNQSTVGWSITQILLDFMGGIMSIAQLGIDSYLQKDWSGITGNPAKLALGNVSIFFDVIFLIQHYWLYRKKGGSAMLDDERGALLRDRID